MCRFLLIVVLLFCMEMIYANVTTRINVDPKIVGGENVDIRNFSYQVSMQYAGQHFCGGSLILPDTVLSAAHCFSASIATPSSNYKVRIGSNRTDGSSGQTIQMCSIKVHGKYNSTTLDNDISIITLCSNATLSETVQLITLSEKENYTSGSSAIVSGWGYEVEGGNLSTTLRAVSVPLATRKYCTTAYKNIVSITKNMICAGYEEGGKDSCQGDSGGPLVQNNQLIGVVSFGVGCAKQSYPGVYSNVANLIDWIAQNSKYQKTSDAQTIVFNVYLTLMILLILFKIT